MNKCFRDGCDDVGRFEDTGKYLCRQHYDEMYELCRFVMLETTERERIVARELLQELGCSEKLASIIVGE